MKLISLHISFLFLLCTSSFHLGAQAQPKLKPINYEDGETLEYKIYYKTGFFWFGIGEVQVKSSVTDSLSLSTLKARTYPKWRKLQHIDVVMTSMTEAGKHFPSGFKRMAFENGNTVYDSVLFKQKDLKVDQYLGTTITDVEYFDLPLKDKVHDVVSFLFSLREIPFDTIKKGEAVPRRLYYNKRAYTLALEYQGKVDKKVKRLGKYPTHHFKIKALKGIHFDEEDVMQVWISEGDNNRPMVIEAPMKVGSVRVVFKKS